MSYNEKEESDHGGSPIELYLFEGVGSKRYLYTTDNQDVVRNGLVYESVAMSRDSLKAGTQSGDDHALEIELPVRTQLVIDYATRISPPILNLTIYRYHNGDDPLLDSVIYWTGPVVSFNVGVDTAVVRSKSIFGSALSGNVPSVYYQSPCNWVLYDGRCQVSRPAWTFNADLVAVSLYEIEVDNIPSGFAAGTFIGGEMVCDRTGERRSLVGQVGNILTANYPFADLQMGDTVTVSAGCDHSAATCKNKFNNRARYGGFLHIPWNNPFADGVE